MPLAVPRRRGSPDTFQDQVRVDASRITHRRYDTTQPRVSRLAPLADAPPLMLFVR